MLHLEDMKMILLKTQVVLGVDLMQEAMLVMILVLLVGLQELKYLWPTIHIVILKIYK